MDRNLVHLIEGALGIPPEEVARLEVAWPRELGLSRLELETHRGARLSLSSNVGGLERGLPALLRAAGEILRRLPEGKKKLWMEAWRTIDGDAGLRLKVGEWNPARAPLEVKVGREGVRGGEGLSEEEVGALLEALEALWGKS